MKDYTPEQGELISATGSVFTEACPGAGKTYAIAKRFYERASAEQRCGVALISFTNAATNEALVRCNKTPELLVAPHFIGTVDAFINRFIVQPGFQAKYRMPPIFIDTWARIGVQPLRLRSPYHKCEFPLDAFDIDFACKASINIRRLGAIERNYFLKLPPAQKVALERRAGSLYFSLIKKGYLTSQASHVYAMNLIAEEKLGKAILARIRSRIIEIIVDEAQDCNADEIKILNTLHETGINLIMVADAEQAIYDFRGASQKEFIGFTKLLTAGKRLDGNFRSTPAICKISDSLRSTGEQDKPVGKYKDDESPIRLVISDSESKNLGTIKALLSESSIPVAEAVVLSHKRNDALKLAGHSSTDQKSTSKVIALVLASSVLKAPRSMPVDKASAISTTERSILNCIENIDCSERTILDICVRNGIDPRWLKEECIRFCMQLPNPGNYTAPAFTALLISQLSAIRLQPGMALKSLGRSLPTPRADTWNDLVTTEIPKDTIAAMTIHGAKGLQFRAVALNIPAGLVLDENELSVLDHWEKDMSSESRRVLYVGASRAEQLLMIVSTPQHREQLVRILHGSGTPYEIHES